MSRHLLRSVRATSFLTRLETSRALVAGAIVCMLALGAYAQDAKPGNAAGAAATTNSATNNTATTTSVDAAKQDATAKSETSVKSEDQAASASAPKVEYVRAAASAKLYNLPDPKAVVMTTVEKGALLHVKEVRGTWLAVEPAGGIPVWVYGKYLAAADEGRATVVGTKVRMRPLPNTNQESYPLDQLLQGRETLKVLQRADETKPLEKDWVKVLAPAGTIAWVQASLASNQPVADGAAAMTAEHDAALAKLAVVSLPKSFASGNEAVAAAKPAETKPTETKPSESKPADAKQTESKLAETTPAAAPKPENDAEYAKAEALYESTRSGSASDWSAVKAAYEGYLQASPKGALAANARMRIEECELRLQMAQIEADKKMLEKERAAQLEEAQRRLKAASLAQDPLWGRFQARGWLELDPMADPKSPRWLLRFGGKTVAEVVCGTGRYDLSQYSGYEIGVMGTITRGAIGEPGTTSARPMRVDAARLEVISGRAARR